MQTPPTPHARSPVGSFWWKDVLKLFQDFCTRTICKPNMGNSVLIWKDNWLNPPPSERFPHLFSFAKKQKCSLKFFMESDASRNFTLPLSVQASQELIALQESLQQEAGDEQDWDIWSYRWNSQNFCSKKAYKHLQGIQVSSPLFKWMWSAGNLGKHKFFF